MSSEPVRVRNYLDAGDTNSTLSALRGARRWWWSRAPDELMIRGGGLRDLSVSPGTIDVGNAAP